MNNYWYIVSLVISFLVTVIATLSVRRLAQYYRVVDDPEADPGRKIHTKATPLLGGLAIYVGIILTMWLIAIFSGELVGDGMPWKYLVGITVGGLWLVIGGVLDDKRNLSAGKQIIWPLLAGLTIIISGIGIDFITNPFGGIISFNQFQIDVIRVGETVFQLTLFADTFAFIWLLGMMYTTKFLDGLDGLVSGMTGIGAIFIFIVSLQPDVAQPGTAMLAAIITGSCIGFLLFNWHPAKIFLGEGGSVLLGFMLGTVSIISGSKIATALLIMGIPALDVAWVIIRRVFIERRSPLTGDKKHLHFRIMDAGLSHRKTVTFLFFLSSVFGLAGLFVTGTNKALTLGILVLVMVVLAGSLVFVYKIKHPKIETRL
jgi:UDP-GlcNAc:undecaprenyl-phosphate GlcNAc-1-phosphate transferase